MMDKAYSYMDFNDLKDFQAAHEKWLEHNFPGQTAHQGLLGIIEEVGELSHAHLKYEQGIRRYTDANKYEQDSMDAIGDIMVYIASYCNTNGLDMAACLQMAWGEVKDRDWQKYPEAGTPDAEQPEAATPGVSIQGRS